MESGREEILETLHAAAMEIQASDSVQAACDRTVAAAEDVLDFEMCSIILHEDGWLVPVAVSAGAPVDGVRRVEPDQGLAGKTFQTGTAHVVDEIEPNDETDPAKEFYRSGMSVAIGDVGVFQAVSGEVAAFDESDVEFTELLVAHTARTVDRIQYEAELRERRETLQRQNERLEEFVDVVSHDLRNPLNVASGELALARADSDSDHLAGVAREHGRMETLIEALLALAREGRPVEEYETVDLASLADSCWMHVETPGATLDVRTTLSVSGDSNRLRQLFENLFGNAIEHGSTTEGNRSDAGAEHDGEGLTVVVDDLADGSGFYVADDGPGIPADRRSAVFEKGYSSSETGTGFGLAIVSSIVDAHDWEIAVTESETGGARFDVTVAE